MRAMVLKDLASLEDNPAPLTLEDVPKPEPAADEVLIKIHVCGVCHTELDEIEGRTPPPDLPVIPGHQVIGTVAAAGADAKEHKEGDRVGVAWVFTACGECRFCKRGEENLCPDFQATGRDKNGGYADYMTVPASYACKIPERFDDTEAAPLLCAGAIGYRSLRLTGLENGQALGLTGFGASGHLVLPMARHKFPDSDIYVFARREEERDFAKELGAVWAGDTMDDTPEPLHAVIDTTPAWLPIIGALKNLEPGGRVVVNAIRKEAGDKDELMRLDYPEHLWMEREIKSVANITRRDVREFLMLAAEIPLTPETTEYALEEANDALVSLKTEHVRGAKVLRIAGS